MLIIAIIASLLLATAAGFIVRAVTRAPVAWEDERGFHLGTPVPEVSVSVDYEKRAA